MEKQIFVMGDIHGRWKPIRDFYNKNKEKLNLDKTENYMILLGDAGLNYFLTDRDRGVKGKLSKLPFTYFVIRGNHEERPSILAEANKDTWTVEPIWDGAVYVEKDFPKIKYAMDNVSMYNIEGYKTLIIPGAYSVDKYHRLANGWNWFEHEQLTEEEIIEGRAFISSNAKFDLVLSHTCPCIFEPTDLFLSVVDQSTVDKTMERFLGEIEFELDYRAWMWAHYHTFRDYPRDDSKKKLMLYNDYAVNLKDYIENEEFEKYEAYNRGE